MGTSSLLGRLKRAVKKIKFLLNFDIHSWSLASMAKNLVYSSKLRLSFNDRAAGLAACTDGLVSNDHSGSSRELQRTVSYPSEVDVDKRADLFIANFYRQLRIERQISLELRYCHGNSFKLVSP